MNNALNAKLSKLVYAPAPDILLNDAPAFDRLLLLVRRLYSVLDGHAELVKFSLRLRYGKGHGLITLEPAMSESEASTLRLQRWLIYARLAERISDCGEDISVALDDVVAESAETAAAWSDKITQMIVRFRLYGSVPARASNPMANRQALQETDKPKQPVKSIITRHGSSLSKINTQTKTENYSDSRGSIKVSNIRFLGGQSISKE